MSFPTLPYSGFSTIRFHVGGYAAYADPSEQVLTRCDQSLTDDHEVMPCTDGIEYPSLSEVSRSLYSFLL